MTLKKRKLGCLTLQVQEIDVVLQTTSLPYGFKKSNLCEFPEIKNMKFKASNFNHKIEKITGNHSLQVCNRT